MTIKQELEYLENVQKRCVRFAKYLEKNEDGRYCDLLQTKITSVIGSIEDVLCCDEQL